MGKNGGKLVKLIKGQRREKVGKNEQKWEVKIGNNEWKQAKTEKNTQK